MRCTHSIWKASLSTAFLLVFLASGCSSNRPEATSAPGSADDGASAELDLTGYQIAADDIIDVSVWEEPELESSVVVRPDGAITLPLIGSLKAAGRTTEELTGVLTQKYSQFIPDPVLTVSIKEIRGLKVYVTGRVQRPGEYRFGRYVDVLQAIAMAGGLTPFANGKAIRILRRNGAEEQTFDFNYNKVRRGLNRDQNILLRPGDTVMVP